MAEQKYKMLHLAYHIHQQLFVDGLMISGFYNWHKVFDDLQNPDTIRNPNAWGKFGYWHQERKNLNDYDIIFVGISAPELRGNMMSAIRKEIGWGGKTKLVANVDYAVEMWPMAFGSITHLQHELMQADYVFAAENAMVSHLRALLNHPVYQFSHPTDIKILKKFMQPYNKRANRALSLIHRYDNNWMDMYMATRKLKGTENFAILLDPAVQIECLPYFDQCVNGIPYPQFMEMLSKSRIVLDSYHKMHSYGRCSVEAACLKVPMVSTDWVTSSLNLFPDTTVKAGDVNAQYEMAQRLLDDQPFYDMVANKAYDLVENCGYQAAFDNFINMMNDKPYRETV